MNKLYKGAVALIHPKFGGDDCKVTLTFSCPCTKNEADELVVETLIQKGSAVLNDYFLIEEQK